MKKYRKPVLTRYSKIKVIVNTSLALEGTVNISDCTLTRCGSTPPPIKS